MHVVAAVGILCTATWVSVTECFRLDIPGILEAVNFKMVIALCKRRKLPVGVVLLAHQQNERFSGTRNGYGLFSGVSVLKRNVLRLGHSRSSGANTVKTVLNIRHF